MRLLVHDLYDELAVFSSALKQMKDVGGTVNAFDAWRLK
jgi:hypothetical protein